MTPNAAAVFAQVLPVMFIVVFIGERRLTKIRPRRLVERFTVLALLLATPLATVSALYFVSIARDVPGGFAWFIWFVTCMLASAMCGVAIVELTAFEDEKPSGKHIDDYESE